MKRTIFALLAVTGSAFAAFIAPFTNWDDLSKKSSDIVIARCTTTPEPTVIGDGIVWSDIKVIMILKGETKPSTARMASEFWPHQGDTFLMFSSYQSNNLYRAYNATEKYRIVLLGRDFRTNGLAGKSLDEQIQFILRHRLEELSRALKSGEVEKRRLEEGIKK